MKRTRRFLVYLCVLLCLMGFAFADAAYTAGLDCEASEVPVGDSVVVAVNVERSGESVFSSAELIVSYDSSKLSFVSVSGTGSGASVDSETAGTLVIEDCGGDKPLGDGVYELTFSAIASGETSVTLSRAAFSNKEHAETGDLIPALIEPGEVAVTVLTIYSVTLPEEDYVSGEDRVGEGADYTLEVTEYDHYDYEVTATMGGAPASVQDNGDGSFTVEDVSGALVFEVRRSGKEFEVSFQAEGGVDVPEETKARYGEDFSFPLPKREGYTMSVEIVYEDGAPVPFSVNDGRVVIRGDKITGNLLVSFKQTLIPPSPTPAPTCAPGQNVGKDGNTIKTGDEATPLLWLGLLMLGALGVAVCMKRKEK